MARHFYWILAAILIVSGLLRLSIVDHRLPYLQVVDENSDLSAALRTLEGELAPRHYRYHRMLTSNVDLVAVGGLFALTYVQGEVRSVDDFRDLYFADRARFTLATRVLMAGLTVLAIALVAFTGRAIRPELGILAALALAVNSFFLLNSVYAMPDTLIMVAVALFLWLAMRVWQRGRWLDYGLMGAGIAFVMLAKISAAPLGAVFLLAQGARVYRRVNGSWLRSVWGFFTDARLWFAALMTLVFNVLLNPLAFVNLNDLSYELQRLFVYAFGRESVPVEARLAAAQAQLLDMVIYVGRWLLPAALLGVLAALLRHRRSVAHWMLLLAGASTLLPIAAVYTQEYKIFYWTPWIPPLALLAGLGFWAAWRWAGSQVWSRGLALVFIMVPLLLEMAFSLQVVARMREADTRELALNYIEETWPASTRIVSGAPLVFSVPLLRDETSIRRAVDLGGEMLASWNWWLKQPENQQPGPAYDLYGPELQAVLNTLEDLADLLRDEVIQLYIEVDYCDGRDMAIDAESDALFPPDPRLIQDRLELVRVFSPFTNTDCEAVVDIRTALTGPLALHRQERPGPIVRIYQVVQDQASG